MEKHKKTVIKKAIFIMLFTLLATLGKSTKSLIFGVTIFTKNDQKIVILQDLHIPNETIATSQYNFIFPWLQRLTTKTRFILEANESEVKKVGEIRSSETVPSLLPKIANLAAYGSKIQNIDFDLADIRYEKTLEMGTLIFCASLPNYSCKSTKELLFFKSYLEQYEGEITEAINKRIDGLSDKTFQIIIQLCLKEVNEKIEKWKKNIPD